MSGATVWTGLVGRRVTTEEKKNEKTTIEEGLFHAGYGCHPYCKSQGAGAEGLVDYGIRRKESG